MPRLARRRPAWPAGWAVLAIAVLTAAATLAPAATGAPGDQYVSDAGAFGGGGGIIQVAAAGGGQLEVASKGSFTDPGAVAIAPDDSLIASDYAVFGGGTGSILRIDPKTKVQSVLATGGSLVDPWGIALDGASGVYVADPSANGGTGAIFRIDVANGTQKVVSSGGSFADPAGLAPAPSGHLYVADESALGGNGAIFEVDPATGAQRTVASGGSLVDPIALTTLASGVILVADLNAFGTARLIRVDPATGLQTILATGPPLNAPRALAVAADGRVLVADQDAFGGVGGVIGVDPATGSMTTVSTAGLFSDPTGLAIIQNKPPTASFTSTPDPAIVSQLMTVDASSSSDPDGPLAKYVWDFDGDGTYETDTGAVPVVTHIYETTGAHHPSLRVTDANGATAETSREVIVSAPPNPPLEAPQLGVTINGTRVSGSVLVRLPGRPKFELLVTPEHLPVGTQVDTRKGRIRLDASNGVAPKGETGVFYGGLFQIRQRKARFAPAELVLIDRRAPAPPAKGRALSARRKRKRALSVRSLWGVSQGNFRTRGRFASATVRGTHWLTRDVRTGTKIHVRRGSVVVRDFVRHRTLVLRSPKSYFARARGRRKPARSRTRR